MSFDVIIVGVGGQGAILASDIIGQASLLEGKSVRAMETHGMAQRGGSVENHIRIDCRYGGMIPLRCANLMIGLEPAEALRYGHYLSPSGKAVVNMRPTVPPSVTRGQATYPEIRELVEKLEGLCERVIEIDAPALATKAGHPLTMNVIMVGAASKFLPLSEESLLEGVKMLVPKKSVDANVSAFQLGRDSFFD